jgi:hypothetical protein
MNKPLLFPTEEDAVVYLLLMGFNVTDNTISWSGVTPCTHRILYAITWLCDEHGYQWMGRNDAVWA